MRCFQSPMAVDAGEAQSPYLYESLLNKNVGKQHQQYAKNWLHDRQRVVWIELHSVRMRCKVSSRMVNATQSLQRIPRPVHSLPSCRPQKASNLRPEMKWVVKFLIRCCSQLQLDPARVNQEWLEHSDLSPLAKDWTIWVFVLFVASLAAFHLSLKSIRTLGQQRGKKSERKWNGRAQTSKGRSLSYLS